MIRRPPRSTQSRSSAASDVYKRQVEGSQSQIGVVERNICPIFGLRSKRKNLPLWKSKDNRKEGWKSNFEPYRGMGKNNHFGVPPLQYYRMSNRLSWVCQTARTSYTHLRAHETDSYLVCR